MKEFKNKYKEARRALRREYKKDKKARRSEYKSGSSELYSEYLSDLSDYRAKRGRRPAVDPPKRALLEEIGNAVSHGIGSLFAIVALVAYIVSPGATLSQEYLESMGITAGAEAVCDFLMMIVYIMIGGTLLSVIGSAVAKFFN